MQIQSRDFTLSVVAGPSAQMLQEGKKARVVACPCMICFRLGDERNADDNTELDRDVEK